jgi:single-strand DNA-binding protein
VSGSFNSVTVVGHLGRDSASCCTPSGDQVTSFSVATSERYKARDGQAQERTAWLIVSAWGRLTETCGGSLRQGSHVYVDGPISLREYTDQGTERSGAGIANSTLPVIDPAEADVVRLAYDLPDSGEHSHASVAETLNRAGYRMVSKLHPDGYPFTKDTVTAMLRNPFYTGRVRCGEALVPGKHAAIIGQDLYDRLQAVHVQRDNAGRRGSTIGHKHTFVAASLARCTCCRERLRAQGFKGKAPTVKPRQP